MFKSVVEKYFNLPIVSLYSDNRGEFLKLKNFLHTHGISHFTTPPHTPEHNALTERRHRHIVEIGRALLHHANLPHSCWSFAFQTAAYLINRLPTPLHNMKTPFQTLHHITHNHKHLHSFGCLCFPWLKPYTTHKLHPRSIPCIFVGYSSSQYAYYCLDPLTNKIYTSRHVSFFDDIFPYSKIISNKSSTSVTNSHDSQLMHHIIPITPTNPAPQSSQPSATPLSAPLIESVLPSASSSGNNSNPNSSPSNSASTLPTDSIRKHSMKTRSQNNIFKPKRFFAATKHPLPENLEPSSVREAMKHSHWREAMAEEFDALLRMAHGL